MIKTLQVQISNPSSDLERDIARLGPWFHNLHLPDGTQTAPDHPLGDFPGYKWEQLKTLLPDNLAGWSVLDVGCNSGFYSFELAKRGAEVTAIDLDQRYLDQAMWAAKQFGLADQITFRCMPVYDLARVSETYDLVWFMGVLYHLRYPLLALDILARKARQWLVVQSLTTNDNEVLNDTHELGFDDIDRMSSTGWPGMAFVENELLGDPTNWWLPNEAGLQAMIRSAGLDIKTHVEKGTYICSPKADVPFEHVQELQPATGASSDNDASL